MRSPARTAAIPEGLDQVVVLEGLFDAAEARALSPAIQNLPDGELTLDFSRCVEVRDRGLALLAEQLASKGRPVALRGLRAHQRRLLRYFGLEAA
ncbi:MAG: hypothetical protein RL199_1952 [Pseudomonadota bacterium]|jgi:hypothetical protein